MILYQQNKYRFWASLWLGLAVGILLYSLGEWWKSSEVAIIKVDWENDAKWMRVADELQTTSCFRHDFTLLNEVEHAWVKVAAQGGYELTINGSPVGGWTYWRSTRPFQNGLTATGQRINQSDPAVAYNFPREYQWTGHKHEQTPVYYDIRPFLQKGKNSICIEGEARKAQSAVILSGEIHLTDGAVVPLASGAFWDAEPVPLGCSQDEWVQAEVNLRGWRKAEVWQRGPRFGHTIVPMSTFSKPFHARWVGLAQVPNEQSGYENLVLKWDQNTPLKNGILRVATSSPYAIFVNGLPLVPTNGVKNPLHDGGWLIGWEGRKPLAASPTLLDPDETLGLFSGYRFATPSNGDPTINNFKKFENKLNRTMDRPTATEQGEELNDKFSSDEKQAGPQDPYGFDEEISLAPPLEVARNRTEDGFNAYALTKMVRPGQNELKISLVPDVGMGYNRSRNRRVAVDVLLTDINQKLVYHQTGDSNWKVAAEGGDSKAAIHGSAADVKKIPSLVFSGYGKVSRHWKLLALVGFLLVFLFSWRSHFKIGLWVRRSAWFVISMLCVLAFRSSMLERSEFLWFRYEHWRLWALLFSFVLAWLADPILRRFSGIKTHGSGKRWLAVFVLLVVTFVLRAWHLDAQPIDDDEFASIQAVISIVEKGVPEIGKGIWYTRSPLYHYAAGAFTWIFGIHIWSLRLFSVLTALATSLALWCLARASFRNRWVAFGAVSLFAIHPFIIFTSHIARFYQQQQFLFTLTVLCFVKGFIQGLGPRWVVATIFVFGGAMLSQEISATFAPGILVTYLLFGKELPWRWELKAAIASVVVGMCFAVNILVFQMKCLTWTAGVSPNVEATIAPDYSEIGNLCTMFVGYSRLHLLASAFLPLSIYSAIRRGDRVVLSLHTILITSVILANFLITSVSFRYQYALIALWILLCVDGVAEMSRCVLLTLRSAGALRRTGPAIAALIGLTIIASWSPWRIVGSYKEKLLGDSITPLRYVKANMRPTDQIMITEPHPHAAKIEIGKVDYDLSLPILHDFAYWDDGLLRDRSGDAKVVNRLAQIQDLFAKHERIWIVINREKFRSRTRNIRWEYPSAREEAFIRENCRLSFCSYLWNVYLWDRNLNQYHPFRAESNQWVE